jgi:hypothetical protein
MQGQAALRLFPRRLGRLGSFGRQEAAGGVVKGAATRAGGAALVAGAGRVVVCRRAHSRWRPPGPGVAGGTAQAQRLHVAGVLWLHVAGVLPERRYLTVVGWCACGVEARRGRSFCGAAGSPGASQGGSPSSMTSCQASSWPTSQASSCQAPASAAALLPSACWAAGDMLGSGGGTAAAAAAARPPAAAASAASRQAFTCACWPIRVPDTASSRWSQTGQVAGPQGASTGEGAAAGVCGCWIAPHASPPPACCPPFTASAPACVQHAACGCSCWGRCCAGPFCWRSPLALTLLTAGAGGRAEPGPAGLQSAGLARLTAPLLRSLSTMRRRAEAGRAKSSSESPSDILHVHAGCLHCGCRRSDSPQVSVRIAAAAAPPQNPRPRPRAPLFAIL